MSQDATPDVESTELVTVETTAMGIWDETSTVFCPMIREDMTPEERRDTFRQISTAAQAGSDKLQMVLAETLYECRNNGYWKDWQDEAGDSYKNFEDYAERELKIKSTKANLLAQIYKKFVIDLTIPLEALRELRWTIAKELLPVVDQTNVMSLLDITKNMIILDIRAMVRAMRRDDLEPEEAVEELAKPDPVTVPETGLDDKPIKMSFIVSQSIAETVKQALDEAGTICASDAPGEQLNMLAADFLSGAGGGSTGYFQRLDQAIAMVETAYNCKLEVVNTQETQDHIKKIQELDNAAETASVE